MQADDTDVLTQPLDAQVLAQRWRELVDDPRYANRVGKFELDEWGRITVTPVSTAHADRAGRVTAVLLNSLGGHVLPEVGIATKAAVYAPDVAWCSDAFWALHRDETPLRAAPQICVEVASPSNSRPELERKLRAYLDAGAKEVWLALTRSKRIEFHAQSGRIERSAYDVDTSLLFD